jgi:hypothetical protein
MYTESDESNRKDRSECKGGKERTENGGSVRMTKNSALETGCSTTWIPFIL